MAYTLRSNGTPLSTIPMMPNAGLLGGRGMRGLRGLRGLSVSDLVAGCGGTGTGACNPLDSGCVAQQQALVDWAENTFEASFPYGPDSAPPCPDLSNTQQITQAFMANNPVSLGPQQGTIGSSILPPAMLASSPAIVAQYQSAAAPSVNVTPPQNVSLATSTNSNSSAPAAGSTNSNSGAPAAGTTNSNSNAPSGTAASSNFFTQTMWGVPDWALLAAAGVVALMFLGGSHGK